MTFEQICKDKWEALKQAQGGSLTPNQKPQYLQEMAEARGWDKHGGQAGYQNHLAQLAAKAQKYRQAEIDSQCGLSPYSAMINEWQQAYLAANPQE